jgi:hypothetical protein
MNELTRYFQTYDPNDIPIEDVQKDVVQISALFTQAFLEHVRHSMNVNFNYAIVYDPYVEWNDKQIKIEISFVQEIFPNVLEGARQGNKEVLFPLFEYIIDKLNEESNKRHGKFRFYIQGLHVTPVVTNRSGVHAAGVMLKYIPIQVSW